MQENKALITLLIKTINLNITNLQEQILGNKINDIADINFNSGVVRGLLDSINLIHQQNKNIENGNLSLVRDANKYYFFNERTKERIEV